jgi:hypothetical protein
VRRLFGGIGKDVARGLQPRLISRSFVDFMEPIRVTRLRRLLIIRGTALVLILLTATYLMLSSHPPGLEHAFSGPTARQSLIGKDKGTVTKELGSPDGEPDPFSWIYHEPRQSPLRPRLGGMVLTLGFNSQGIVTDVRIND